MSWIKRQWHRFKFWLLGLILIPVAFAMPLSTPTVLAFPSIDFNQKAIHFSYTDDNTGEDLIIRTDRRTYGGWDNSEVFFSVTNNSGQNQTVSVQFLFDNGDLAQISELKEDVPYQISVSDYGKKDYTCSSSWVATTTPITSTNFGTHECLATGLLLDCDTAKGDICTINNAFLGTHQETRYRDQWESLRSNIASKKDIKKIVPAQVISKGGSQYPIPNGETRYFKGDITFPQGGINGIQEEFYIEASGSAGAYGILDPFFDSNFTYCRVITINNSEIATTTTLGYAILATTTDSTLSSTTTGGHVEFADGRDIVFTTGDDCQASSGESLLDYEQESYASTTGEIVFWIQSTDISSTTDENMLMFYGNSSATDQSDAIGTWDSTFAGVWHLPEDPSGGSPQILDSTNNNNDGTSGGSMTTSDQVAGQIDGSLDFDGSDDIIDISADSSLDVPNRFTISVWYKGDSGVQILKEFGFNNRNFVVQSTFLRFSTTSGFGDCTLTPTEPTTGLWHYLVFLYDGIDCFVYIDGSLDSSDFVSGGAAQGIGAPMNFGDTNYTGQMDEVRIQNIDIHDMDILTNYNCEYIGCITFGSEETEDVVVEDVRGEGIIWWNGIIPLLPYIKRRKNDER